MKLKKKKKHFPTKYHKKVANRSQKTKATSIQKGQGETKKKKERKTIQESAKTKQGQENYEKEESLNG